MKIDSGLTKDLDRTRDAAREIASDGYDGLWIGETKHDPFLQCLQAAEATDRLTVGTAIAIAFARTPMTLANIGFDLARYSGGRFVLGLGSQVKPHIERRFSMPWSRPAARMRELVLAVRAIWACWQDGAPLDFRGDFYTHTLMTPFFAPPPHLYGPPPVYLAGVGAAMTEVAGEVADGFFIHPFTTRRYLDEVTLPALRRGREKRDGREKSGTGMEGFTVCGPSFVTVGRDEAELAAAVAGTRAQIAFYASTPAYRGVLDLHGWGDLQPELTTLSRQGRWAEMGSLVDDDLLHAVSLVGTPEQVGKALRAKLGDIAQRTTLYAPYEADPAIWPALIAAAR
jgi:probable F420-dependent oxidoreductase